MRVFQCIATALVFIAVGCGGDPAAKSQTKSSADLNPWMNNAAAQGWTSSGPQVHTGATLAAAPANATPANNAKPAAPVAMPTIPNGARYTIFCETYTTPDHVTLSTNIRNILQANSKLKDWYVVHQPNQSQLYHGYYSDFEPKNAPDAAAKRDAERAQRDHTLVESIPNPTAPQQKMFPRSLFVPLDAPDPDAPPAWNLTNAPGFWTVQVAAYNGPDRKRLAVESVKAAREMNVPAFYYHGDNISSVCIGSWDRTAIKEQNADVAGSVDSDPGARDNSEMIVNYTGQDISESVKGRVGPDGKPIRVLQAKLDILDPTLLQTLKQYPAHAVNGEEQLLDATNREGQKIRVPRPSFIVRIPRANVPAVEGRQTNEPEPTLVRPGNAGSDLRARLKGIGQ